MYAIIETGGKQYRVENGSEIFVEKLNVAENETVTFDKVVAYSDAEGNFKAGTPYVEGVKVTATVLGRAERGVEDGLKGDKVLVFKKKRRKGYQKCNGHRQYLTKLQINSIA